MAVGSWDWDGWQVDTDYRRSMVSETLSDSSGSVAHWHERPGDTESSIEVHLSPTPWVSDVGALVSVHVRA